MRSITLIQRVLRRLLGPDPSGGVVTRYGALYRAWGHVFGCQIQGAYYEFGVYRGETFRMAHSVRGRFLEWVSGQLTSTEAWRRRALEAYPCNHGFYALDTFSGIPENSEGAASFQEGSFACTLEEFRALNERAGIREGGEVCYFQGLFADVDPATFCTLQPAAIVNLDSDLYLSARDALHLIAPKLQQGTVLLADDYNCFSARDDAGERRALAEFQNEYPFRLEPWFPYHFSGQAFLIHSCK